MDRTTISCAATCGHGGLGHHLGQLVDDARENASLAAYFCSGVRLGDEDFARPIDLTRWHRGIALTPVRFDLGWRNYIGVELFDRAVARRISAPVEVFVGFVGQSRHSFCRARDLCAVRLELHAANSHVNNVTRVHRQAVERYGIEPSWLNEAQVKKTIREYELADIIWVASEYSRRSFLAEGVSDRKLRRIYLRTHPRFKPVARRVDDGVFRIVYVGSLTVTKGIPTLLDAFSQIDGPAELTLVGGWSTRPMRKYLLNRSNADPRIRIAPGDPLPHLHKADVCVHPSFEDGWAYAPAEALACGLPVIVSDQTGMKELIGSENHGYVFPAGDENALYERLQTFKRIRL
jgi:glycosyltransferase involved in cell wall biosynthesis